MNRTLLTLVGLLVGALNLPGQIATFPNFAPAVTTGAVGLAASQTAQLNVVNLITANSTTSTTPTTACPVQLEFWDSMGKLVKSLAISNLSPGATGSLQLKLTEVTTNTSPLRTEVRGVVRRTTPTPTPGTGTSPILPGVPPGASQTIIFAPACSVATTLEVFDTTTGVTQSLTSDLHALEDFTTVVPLPAMLGR
jgi:hypothetical protein